jgi:succinyl-CoA synthetase beta subunit
LKLYEHEAKALLRNCQLPTSNGIVINNPAQARSAAETVGLPVAVKAQVLVAGRGKAGGILFADTALEAEQAAEKLLNTTVKGEKIRQILIEQKLVIKKELYFAVTVDRLNRTYTAIASQVGGVNIEQVAKETPDKIFKHTINPRLGFRPFHARQIASWLGYSGNQMLELAGVLEKIWGLGMEVDAELIECNPLIETPDGKFVAADARIIVDDNALFRHPQLQQKQLETQRELTAVEKAALQAGLEYVKLDGEIGVIGNGAGLVMATLDMVNLFGGKPADFLDLGGGASVERIAKALMLVLGDVQVRVVFVNVLGGMTRCDEVAEAIVEVTKKSKNKKPLVARLVGTNELEGKTILMQAGLAVFDNMEQAAEKAVALAKEA